MVVRASMGLFRLLRKKLTIPLKPLSSSPPAPSTVPAFLRTPFRSPTSIPYSSLILALLVSKYSMVSLTPIERSTRLREKKSNLLYSSSFSFNLPAASIAATGFILATSTSVGGGGGSGEPKTTPLSSAGATVPSGSISPPPINLCNSAPLSLSSTMYWFVVGLNTVRVSVLNSGLNAGSVQLTSSVVN